MTKTTIGLFVLSLVGVFLFPSFLFVILSRAIFALVFLTLGVLVYKWGRWVYRQMFGDKQITFPTISIKKD